MNQWDKKNASNQTAAIPKGVQVLQNFRWACKVLPALCAPGLNSHIFRGYCLSVADNCLYCCCAAAHCSVGLFGGRIRRKETQEKKTTETVTMSSYWQWGGGVGTAVRHKWCQIPFWQWNVSVVWGAQISQWKVVGLTSVCLGPKDGGNGSNKNNYKHTHARTHHNRTENGVTSDYKHVFHTPTEPCRHAGADSEW